MKGEGLEMEKRELKFLISVKLSILSYSVGIGIIFWLKHEELTHTLSLGCIFWL